jgi:hypothetical protein
MFALDVQTVQRLPIYQPPIMRLAYGNAILSQGITRHNLHAPIFYQKGGQEPGWELWALI